MITLEFADEWLMFANNDLISARHLKLVKIWIKSIDLMDKKQYACFRQGEQLWEI